MRILLYYAHPLESTSKLNKTLLDKVRDQKNIKIRHLDELYPALVLSKEQIAEEQRRIEKADAIFFQYPVYWYNCPASMKAFLDCVFTIEWAGGAQKPLTQKKWRVIMTCGATLDSYTETITPYEISRPVCAMGRLFQCVVLKPFALFGDDRLEDAVPQYVNLFSEDAK